MELGHLHLLDMAVGCWAFQQDRESGGAIVEGPRDFSTETCLPVLIQFDASLRLVLRIIFVIKLPNWLLLENIEWML